jgi:GNAT superfamily N-acetyltransferase
MNKKQSIKSPALLDKSHDVSSFDCGEEALNDYLAQFAYINNKHSSSRTYVACIDNRIVGYYTLTIGSVTHEEAASRTSKGMALHRPIPVIILARLAIDQNEQGKGIGKALLKDALIKATRGADIIGGRAILVHAKNKKAKDFYQKYGFEPSPIDEYHLFLLLKDIKKTLKI